MKQESQFGLFGPPRGQHELASRPALAAVGVFAGIGGIELGLSRSGHRALMLCENEPGALAVLEARFPGIPLHKDIRDLRALPDGTELLMGGFPCQDLSQAGPTHGITGSRSGLIDEVFRLLATHDVPWVLLENVPFMLQLHQGGALDHIIGALENLGYDWAYRVVDSRSMGLPQRRERVYLIASRVGDPRGVVLADDAGEPTPPNREAWREVACGFYWTEGLRGLGWAQNAVPTLKGGSTIGIPSPPAIVLTSGEIVQPDLRDAERLQGFPVDWTEPCTTNSRPSHRWKLIGNAVTVDVPAWIGGRLCQPGAYDARLDVPLVRRGGPWPRAAWGAGGERWISQASAWPFRRPTQPLEEFLAFPPKPLSVKAAAGFFSRASRAKLRFPPGFLDLVAQQASATQRA